MARLRRAGCEAAGLEGVSPALRAWASDFGKTQSHQRSSPPLIRPTYVGFLRLTRLSNGTRRRAVHGPAPLARHPVSRPGQAGSPQRIRGGPPEDWQSYRFRFCNNKGCGSRFLLMVNVGLRITKPNNLDRVYRLTNFIFKADLYTRPARQRSESFAVASKIPIDFILFNESRIFC